MKHLFALLPMLAIAACAQERPLLLQPPWLQLKVAEYQKLAPFQPPRSILRATYEGKRVYYVSPACCDIPSELYDAGGTLLCFPDGGFAGGDGRCPRFSLTGNIVSTIWRDERDGGAAAKARNGMNTDLILYAIHLLFWGPFVITRMVLRRRAPASQAAEPAVEQPPTAPYSRLLLAFHGLAFGLMYFGIGAAVLPNRVPTLFPGQRIAGALVIALGAFLTCWALTSFASWRFRARLDAGHILATDGAFRLVRHPIYLGLDLLAIGTAVWVPSPILGFAALLMVIGSDLRARAEEKLLSASFGATYDDYCTRTRRFVPWIY